MIRTLIADDEQHALDRLKDLLGDYEEFLVVAEARDGTSALEKIVSRKPDVAFLDINMPGVSVFKTIGSLQDPPLIIFQTAHSKYATDAFDVSAVDYLLKPVGKERFSQAVKKIREKLSAQSLSFQEQGAKEEEYNPVEKISVKVHGTIKIIPISEIRKICFEEGLSFIYAKEGRFLSDHSLNYYEEKFRNLDFFRSNRANLINLEFVSAIHKAFKGNYFVEMSDGSKVDLSRRKAMSLKKIVDF